MPDQPAFRPDPEPIPTRGAGGGPGAPPPPPPALRPLSFVGLCIGWGFVAFFALSGIVFLVVVDADFRTSGAGLRPALSGAGLGVLSLAGAAGTAGLIVWQQRRGARNIAEWEREHGATEEAGSQPSAD